MENTNRNTIMFHSQLPLPDIKPHKSEKDLLRMSLINLNGNTRLTTESASNKKNLSYKYKRVNNMFKLVQVQENCQQTKSKVSEVDQMYEIIKKINQRVTQLQRKIEKEGPSHEVIIDSIRQEISWLAQRDNEIEVHIKNQTKQIKQLRQRIQQMEQQQSSHNITINSLKIKIQQFRTSLSLTAEDNINSTFDRFVNQKISILSAQITKQIEQVKNWLQKWQSSQNFSVQQQKNINPFNLTRKKMKLKHQQIYKDIETGNSYLVQQNLYYVDSEGRMLDSDGYRIVGPRNQQIKLDSQHIKKLKQFGILR